MEEYKYNDSTSNLVLENNETLDPKVQLTSKIL